jgi:hypothetical protein
VSGCSDNSTDKSTAADKDKHGTLFKEPIKALDKASGVQKQLDEAAKKQAKELERQAE